LISYKLRVCHLKISKIGSEFKSLREVDRKAS
jgi:hypothetical protein